jgi:hypothetical protein
MDINVTTNVVRITEVLTDAPIDAISNGKNTTDGIARKKLMVPRVVFSPEGESAIEIPSNSAIEVPKMNPQNEIKIVIPTDCQKNTVNTSGMKSRAISQECGKESTSAMTHASSQRMKLVAAIDTHLYVRRICCI